MNYYLDVLKKYATFEGRARRKEYWMFNLFNALAFLVLGFISSLFFRSFGSTLFVLYGLGTLLPSLAVLVRRLHDVNRSGGWIFFSLVPLVGSITLLVWTLCDSTAGENKYGPNPKGV